MNVLTDGFPQSVEIDGVEYPINADYRVGLDIMLAFEDNSLTAADKQMVAITLLYKEIPPDLTKACELAVLFLNCGEEEQPDVGERPTRLYSFEKDAKYIYSAIRQTHGIDLETVSFLHWWKFCYLFLDLDPDCFFQQMLHLRRQKQAGKLTKDERELWFRMEDILNLPGEYDTERVEAEEEFMRRLTPARIAP